MSPKSGAKKSEHYFYSQEEIDEYMRSLAPTFDKSSLNIQRFKVAIVPSPYPNILLLLF